MIGSLALLGAGMSVLFPLAMGMLFNSAVPRAEIREVFTIILGLAVGAVASRVSLPAGFGMIAAVYAVAFGSACWPVKAERAMATAAD